MRRIRNHRSRGCYRSREGVIFGVLRGIAEYFDFSVFWIRAGALCIDVLLIVVVSVVGNILPPS